MEVLKVSSSIKQTVELAIAWCNQCGDFQEVTTEGECSNCGSDDCLGFY